MNHPNDYIKLNDNNTSRPIVGVYELSSILTNTSELLANTPNLNEFLKDDDKMINDFINPSELALELFKQGIFDILLLIMLLKNIFLLQIKASSSKKIVSLIEESKNNFIKSA